MGQRRREDGGAQSDCTVGRETYNIPGVHKGEGACKDTTNIAFVLVAGWLACAIYVLFARPS